MQYGLFYETNELFLQTIRSFERDKEFKMQILTIHILLTFDKNF